MSRTTRAGRWTRKRPRKAGYYWWREPEFNENKPEICKVFLSDEHELRVEWINNSPSCELVEEFDGEWQPVPAPRE